MELRWYQKEAVAAVYDFLRRDKEGAPCVVLPTGAGKTPVLATLCADVARWGGRALVLAHVQELLKQSARKIAELAPDASVGVYSAGIGERTTDAQIVVAGIQSAYNKARELGGFRLVIVDEAHLIPEDGDGRYRTFLTAAKEVEPTVRLVGLTATPYRLGCGAICGPDRFLTKVCYEVGVKQLIEQGFLSPIRTRNGRKRPDFSGVAIKNGEYDSKGIDAVIGKKNVIEAACSEVVELTKDRKKVLVFCHSVAAAERAATALRSFQTDEVATVTGETPTDERNAIIDRFKYDDPPDLFGRVSKPLKYLTNVNVLTTGFDAPNVDCVVLLRPTQSTGLYQQMVGRGLRLAPGKKDCLLLDYGQNVVRLGPIDAPVVRPTGASSKKQPNAARECPNCHTVSARAFTACPECGTVFPVQSRDDPELSATSATDPALDEGSDLTYDVDAVAYSEHLKRGAPSGAPRTLRVDYEYAPGKFLSQWLCPEHVGWVRLKFEEWWREKSKLEPPRKAYVAAELANAGALAFPLKIRAVRAPGKRFPEIAWIERTETPDFDPTKRASPQGFNDFDRCGQCMNYSAGYCAAFDTDVDAEAPICGRFAVADDVPF